MKKRFISIMTLVILATSFVLPALIPKDAWADTSLESYCYQIGGSISNGTCVISGITKTKCDSYSNSSFQAPSSSDPKGKCYVHITNSSNSSDNKSDDSSSNDSNSDDSNSNHESGSSSSKGSNAKNTPTASTPEDMNKVCPDGQVYTTILGGGGCQDAGTGGEGIFSILGLILNILTYGVGIAGVLGIVLSGVQYLTARDNEQQVAKAKSRIINIIIGLAIYAVMWGFLQWIIPGGILNGK